MEREQQMHNLLKECNDSQQSINDVTDKYLKVNRNERLAIAKIIENFMDFELYELQCKMTVLEIITELLLNDRDKTYVLHLSSRILSFVRRHKHFILQDPHATQKLKKIMQKWRTKKIFSQQFMKKFFEYAGRALQAVLMEENESANHFVRYSKTMVMGIADVRKHKATALLYELKCRADKLGKQTANLHKQQDKMRDSSAEGLQLENGRQLLKITDKLIEQHTKMLIDLHQGSEELFNFFKAQSQTIDAYPTPSDS